MKNPEAKKAHKMLSKRIKALNKAYHEKGVSKVTDTEYDKLYENLKELEVKHPELITPDSPTQQIGSAPSSNFQSVRHLEPMMSLDNIFALERLEKKERGVAEFVNSVEKILPKEQLKWTVEPKIDGLAVNLRYENGIFNLGATRGDGEQGDDITKNLREIKNLPRKLESRSSIIPKIVEIRGEVFMPTSVFNELNENLLRAGEEPFKNARNAAAGSLRQLDSKIVSERQLDILCYGIGFCDFSPEKTPKTQMDLLNWIQSNGFKIPDNIRVEEDVEGLIDAIKRIESARDDFPYKIDGAVIKLNDLELRKKVGVTSKAPRWAIAYKYAPEQKETKLKDITIQVGRTGVLTPVAELDPVFLDGSTVSRATLHNEDEIARKDIRIGDTVIVEKRGDVIPGIARVVLEKRSKHSKVFNFVEHINGKCPVCGSKIHRDEKFVAWKCENLSCPAQTTRRLEFFASRRALDVEGLGEKVADKLTSLGLVKEPLDLFKLKDETLATLNLGTQEEPRFLGLKNASKIISAIARSKQFTLARWIYAFAIPEVGETTAYQLATTHSSIKDLASSSILKDVRDLGELESERQKITPHSRKNPPKTIEEKKDRIQRNHELTQLIEPIERRLRANNARSIMREVGPVAANSVLDFFSSSSGRALLERLDDLNIHPSGEASKQKSEANDIKSAITNKTFVLTGTLSAMSRDEATEKIRAAGGTVSGSMSSKTDFLVVGENAGSKLTKAQDLGIKTLSECEFLELLGSRTVENDNRSQKDLFVK